MLLGYGMGDDEPWAGVQPYGAEMAVCRPAWRAPLANFCLPPGKSVAKTYRQAAHRNNGKRCLQAMLGNSSSTK